MRRPLRRSVPARKHEGEQFAHVHDGAIADGAIAIAGGVFDGTPPTNDLGEVVHVARDGQRREGWARGGRWRWWRERRGRRRGTEAKPRGAVGIREGHSQLR